MLENARRRCNSRLKLGEKCSSFASFHVREAPQMLTAETTGDNLRALCFELRPARLGAAAGSALNFLSQQAV